MKCKQQEEATKIIDAEELSKREKYDDTHK